MVTSKEKNIIKDGAFYSKQKVINKLKFKDRKLTLHNIILEILDIDLVINSVKLLERRELSIWDGYGQAIGRNLDISKDLKLWQEDEWDNLLEILNYKY